MFTELYVHASVMLSSACLLTSACRSIAVVYVFTELYVQLCMLVCCDALNIGWCLQHTYGTSNCQVNCDTTGLIKNITSLITKYDNV